MGAANSNLTRCIEDEHHRLVKHDRDYLVIDEILSLRLPPSSWSVDTSHLGVIFMLDSDRDGRFTLEEIGAFVDLARERSKAYAPHEFTAQMQGYCSIQLWKWASAPGGAPAFEDWILQLLEENAPTRTFNKYPGQLFLSSEAVEALFHIVNVQETQGVGFQEFLDLLQRAGEEAGLMALGAPELDDWVPAAAVRDCVGALCRGMLAVMEATFPSDERAEL